MPCQHVSGVTTRVLVILIHLPVNDGDLGCVPLAASWIKPHKKSKTRDEFSYNILLYSLSPHCADIYRYGTIKIWIKNPIQPAWHAQ